MGPVGGPSETDPPLGVDADAVLPGTVPRERLQPVARQDGQVIEGELDVVDGEVMVRPAAVDDLASAGDELTRGRLRRRVPGPTDLLQRPTGAARESATTALDGGFRSAPTTAEVDGKPRASMLTATARWVSIDRPKSSGPLSSEDLSAGDARGALRLSGFLLPRQRSQDINVPAAVATRGLEKASRVARERQHRGSRCDGAAGVVVRGHGID